MTGVFNNFPNGEEEYNFTEREVHKTKHYCGKQDISKNRQDHAYDTDDTDDPNGTNHPIFDNLNNLDNLNQIDDIANLNNSEPCGCDIMAIDSVRGRSCVSNITHSMLIFMYRTDTGFVGKTHDIKGNCILDNYYCSLSKNISYSNANIRSELYLHNPAILEIVNNFNNKIYDCTKKLYEDSRLTNLTNVIFEIDKVIPEKHFTKNIKSFRKNALSPVLIDYISKFADHSVNIDLLKIKINADFNNGRTKFLTYMGLRCVVEFLNILLYCSKGFKYIGGMFKYIGNTFKHISKGFSWFKSFIY